MKTFLRISAASLLLVLSATGCTTARHAAEDSTDIAAHAVEKTGHAVAHGAEKVDENM